MHLRLIYSAYKYAIIGNIVITDKIVNISNNHNVNDSLWYHTADSSKGIRPLIYQSCIYVAM